MVQVQVNKPQCRVEVEERVTAKQQILELLNVLVILDSSLRSLHPCVP